MTNLDRSVAVMLKNVVEGLEHANAPLTHVYFTEGLKYYGQQHCDDANTSEPPSAAMFRGKAARNTCTYGSNACQEDDMLAMNGESLQTAGVHWGATKAPFDEDDPRHLPPN
jgi:hypothetical protein